MVRSTLPALIRYGKYKIPYHDHSPHKFKTITDKQFNIQLFGMLSGIVLFAGSFYGSIYWIHYYKNPEATNL